MNNNKPNERNQPKRSTLQEDPNVLIDEKTGEYVKRGEHDENTDRLLARANQNAQPKRGDSEDIMDKEDKHAGERNNSDLSRR